MLEPPPTATNASHGPEARASSTAAVRLDVGGLDVHALEDVGLDVELGHLVGHPLREAGGRDPGVGDHQDPLHAVPAEVETDLVGGPAPNFSWGAP